MYIAKLQISFKYSFSIYTQDKGHFLPFPFYEEHVLLMSSLYVITFTTQVDFSLMFILGSIPVFFSFIVVAILTHYNDWDPAWALIKRLYYCFHRLTCLFCTICFICRRKTPHVRYAPSYTPPPLPVPIVFPQNCI